MAADENRQPLSNFAASWAPLLDVASKLSLLGSVFLYTVGLIISNSYAQQFGRYTLSLAKAEYILVGLVWTLLAILGYLMYRTIRDTWQHSFSSQELSIYKRMAGILGVAIITAFCGAGFSLVGAVLGLHNFADKNSWIVFAVLLATGGSIDISIRQIRTLLQRGNLLDSLSNVFVIFDLIRYVYFLPILILLYATVVFPLFRPSLGGGKMQQAEFFIKEPSRDFFRDVQIHVAKNGSIGTWSIVAELSDAFVITTTGNPFESWRSRTVWVRKENVEMLLNPQPPAELHKPTTAN